MKGKNGNFPISGFYHLWPRWHLQSLHLSTNLWISLLTTIPNLQICKRKSALFFFHTQFAIKHLNNICFIWKFSVLLHSTHAYDWHIKTDINLIRLKTNWIGCNRVNKLLMTTSTSVWSPHSITVGAIDAMITVENAFPTLAIYGQCQDTNYIYFES